jgi:dipeptidyl aminopeptidase/acylaminoacyl peptidase
MKGLKTYRHKDNPKEKELHDNFIKEHGKNMSLITYPLNDHGVSPSKHLTEHEEQLVITTIQWLGSPVGQSFLERCGFVLNE